MRFSVGCRLDYEVGEPTVVILNVEAMRLDNQVVLDERVTLTPGLDTVLHVDAATGMRLRRFVAPPGPLRVDYAAEVELAVRYDDPGHVAEVPVAELPLAVVPFLAPSRFCLSDKLERFARRTFQEMPAGHTRVTAICNWIHDHVDYLAASSDALSDAGDTFALRAGVCRDFAHLGISFCRALGIPARYVSCYAWQLVPPDFHAVFEAYLGGRWYLFDATRRAALDGFVRIGCGRDAADAPFATLFGTVEPKAMAVSIAPSGSVAQGAPLTVAAVSGA